MILCKEAYAKAIDKAIFPGTQGGPLMHVIAAKAVCFGEALKPEFRQYQQQIIRNAKALENVLRRLDVRMVSDGTDNHLLLLDLTNTSRTGKELEELLGRCNITVNKNTIPGEKLSPMIASGIRVGTPAVTTRRHGGKRHGADRSDDPHGDRRRRRRLPCREASGGRNDAAFPAVRGIPE